ncbi:DMT family transporter [Pelagibius sp. Alg239-R121]|uniref:DMT family transporter n=1 Tax=Pelagibius sp. Alg239-R121 TaxID=2993448 RepID=UPI0024A65872|nr:DMT family transporter [Pelagibius sp. Alg239-R121]
MTDASVRTGSSSGSSKGILWMLLTMLLFVSMDTAAKHLTQSYPVLQVVWARYFFHALLLALYLNRRIPGLMRTKRLGIQLFRSLLLLVTTVLFFTGISLIPLADASAIMFVAPIIVTALSMPLLKEKVGPRRWVSIVVGFIGALIIIRPGGETVQIAALLPFCAACCYALYQIITRSLSHSDQPLTTLAYTALVGAVVMCFVAPFNWQSPDTNGWLLMILIGFLGGISQFTLIKAFQSAPAAAVTPFSYSSLIWATFYGFIVFGDLPDQPTVAGALIIAASGLYIFHRENLKKRSDGT